VQWELALQFCFALSTGVFVLVLVLVLLLEPTASITSTSTISLSASTTEPTHRRVGCRAILRSGDHIFALVAKDLERFVEDRSNLGKDRATTNPTAFVVLDFQLKTNPRPSNRRLLRIPSHCLLQAQSRVEDRSRRSEDHTIRDARKADSDPTEIEDTPASRRQRILELLGDGGKLRSTCIATHLGCSLKNVKRELETLRLAGKIEFIGPNKTGTYQLVAG